jgi:hypothetical protein
MFVVLVLVELVAVAVTVAWLPESKGGRANALSVEAIGIHILKEVKRSAAQATSENDDSPVLYCNLIGDEAPLPKERTVVYIQYMEHGNSPHHFDPESPASFFGYL